MYIFIAIFAIYIVILLVDINSSTIDNVKFHEGGFLNAGYSTNDSNDLKTVDIWKAVFWPVRLFFVFLPKEVLCLINFLVGILLLAFGCEYRKSKLYNWIDHLV